MIQTLKIVQTGTIVGIFWIKMGFLTFLLLYSLLDRIQDPDLQTLICGLLRTE